MSKGTVAAASQDTNAENTAASLVDNRTNSVSQLKLNEALSNAQSESTPVQLKSKVRNTGQAFTWGPNKTMVGHSMKAWLDPHQPLRGESASANTDQTPMMDALRAHFTINGGDLVKGHLLNDNLGGKALNNNLFPITRAANKQHLMTTENYAKTQLWTHAQPIWYSVDVTGTPNATQSHHQFNVALGPWNMATGHEGTGISGSIVSNMGDPRDSDGANPNDMDTYGAESLRVAVGRERALHPHAGPGTMSQQEQYLRDRSGSITNTNHDNTGYTHFT
jgi:hypothetical protein